LASVLLLFRLGSGQSLAPNQGFRSRPPLFCVVDSPCVVLLAARRQTGTTHKSDCLPARSLLGPCLDQALCRHSLSHETQRKPTTNQPSRRHVSSLSWLPAHETRWRTLRAERLMAIPDGIVQERSARRTTDRPQSAHGAPCSPIRPFFPPMPASLGPAERRSNKRTQLLAAIPLSLRTATLLLS
jgi:hypothetical protein